MGKEPCTKYCDVLISSHEVMKLQSFERSIMTSFPRMWKTFHPWFSLHVVVNFKEKETFTQICGRLTISHKLMKLRSFQ